MRPSYSFNTFSTHVLAAMWGAGLSFHRCHAELNVPVDPYLDHVFDGEEGSRGIRFFTHGYDVYTPHRVLVTHDYVSSNTRIIDIPTNHPRNLLVFWFPPATSFFPRTHRQCILISFDSQHVWL